MDFKTTLVAIVLAVAGGLFYWYEYRPSGIRKECAASAAEAAKQATKDIAAEFLPPKQRGKLLEEGFYSVDMRDNYYRTCLQSEGLAE